MRLKWNGLVSGSLAFGLLVAAPAWADDPPMSPEINAAFQDCVAAAPDQNAVRQHEASCSRVIDAPGVQPVVRSYAYTQRGALAFGMNDLDKAIGDFDAALELNPKLDQALEGRAAAFLNTGKPEQAIGDYNQLLQAHPGTARLLVGRGDALNNLRQYDRAIADFDKALAIEPKNDEAMNDRAWAYQHKGDLTQAIKGYSDALALATELRGLILSNRCVAKAMNNDIGSAMADCEDALKTDPKSGDFLATRGFVNLKAKRFDAAIMDYTAALVINPQDSFALYQRGITRIQAGQEKTGRDDLAAAEKLDPKVRESMAEIGVTAP